MAKLLNTTFLVTQSAPATPSSDFGTLFASSSKLFFKNTSGTTYDLTVAGGGGGGLASTLVYTSSGTYTYNTGSNIQYIKVVCAGGGGGGGGGRLGLSGTNRAGGGGGAGGNINIAYFSSSLLTTGSYTGTVGAGGSGGAGRSGSITFTGGNGNIGADSTFASGLTVLLRATGGAFGGGGLTTPGLAGTNVAPTSPTVPNPYPPFYYSGVNGAAGSTTTGANAGNAFNGSRLLAGGGGGGGITNTNISGSGGSGSAIYNYTSLIQSGSPGIVPGGVGQNGASVIDISHLLFYSGSNLTVGASIGTGGHGGGGGSQTPVTSAGNGGSGSMAAGGGGGGATIVNTVSGTGGRGGDGFVLIFEYY